MTSAQVCILISIAVYLIAMLAIGIVCSKRNNTVDDFYLGGRRVGAGGYCHECRGVGYVQLAADGPAGRCLSDRYCGSGMDSHWPWCGHLHQLVGGGTPSAPVFCPHWRHYRAGLFLSPIWREKTYSYRHGSHFNYCILCAVHSLRLCRPAASCLALCSVWTIMWQ